MPWLSFDAAFRANRAFSHGVCLLNSLAGDHQLDCVEVRAVFRHLADHAIARYLEREPAYDCAGSFKSEALGIALLERMESWDRRRWSGCR